LGPQQDHSFIETGAGKEFFVKTQNQVTDKSGEEDFKKFLGAQNPGLSEILQGMLEVNPDKRWSAARCLESPIFDDIRLPAIEKGAIS
jgi:serine/threonine protein kinase